MNTKVVSSNAIIKSVSLGLTDFLTSVFKYATIPIEPYNDTGGVDYGT